MNRRDIVAKWGCPAEVLIKESDPKLGTDIVTWMYYIQDTDGTVSPVFFIFRHG